MRYLGNNEISLLEKIVFVFARFLGALVAIISIVGIILCIAFLFDSFESNTSVTFAEVKSEINKTKSSSTTSNNQFNSSAINLETLPPVLKTYFDGSNQEVLEGWLSKIKSESKRNEFITELADVVKKAEAQDVSPIEAINTYRTLKFKKITKAENQRYEKIARQSGATATIFALLILLVVVALILVLLSIERHTRKTVQYISSNPNEKNA